MARIKVPYTDDFGDTKTGWFESDSAERFEEGTNWDGNNRIGTCSGLQASVAGETLYRTSSGRWVLNRDTRNYFNGPNAYSFLDDEDAQDWLLRSEINEEALEKHFGGVEEESGPGRPEIGPPFPIRFPVDLLKRTDARATELKVSRAELIRQLVDAGLSAAR